MSKSAWLCSHACHLRKREENSGFVFVCAYRCVCACLCSCVWWMEIPDYVFAFSAMLPVCRLLCLHAEQPLHNNEKWHKRKYLSRLWLGLTGSVRSGAPRWQSPYFWEDGPVIRPIYFTPLPCNWTLGHRFNQSCQSLNWEGIWTESKVEKWKGSLFAWTAVSDREHAFKWHRPDWRFSTVNSELRIAVFCFISSQMCNLVVEPKLKITAFDHFPNDTCSR